MLLADICPNFRVAMYDDTNHVEIPDAYGRYILWELPPEFKDALRLTIDTLVKEAGRKALILDKGSRTSGWIVPRERWDHAMSQPVPGHVWITTTVGKSDDAAGSAAPSPPPS